MQKSAKDCLMCTRRYFFYNFVTSNLRYFLNIQYVDVRSYGTNIWLNVWYLVHLCIIQAVSDECLTLKSKHKNCHDSNPEAWDTCNSHNLKYNMWKKYMYQMYNEKF